MKDDRLISLNAAIDAMMKLQAEDIEAYGASIPEGFDGGRAVMALKALPSALPTLDEVYTEQEQAYMEGYEQGGKESLAAMLNAFKSVRDELPADKREGYTDRFCKLMGKMLDELERTDAR